LTYTVVYDHVNVETAADGSGTIVPAQDVSGGSSITVYAIGRAADNSFMSNAPAGWSLVNLSGGLANGDLVPSGDGRSATFTAHLSGSANIEAMIGAATANPSGLITVPSTGTSGAWAVDTDGNWSDASKWSSSPSIPSLPGDSATLGVGSALRTVTLDVNVSLASLALTNPNSFVVTGGNTLTMDNTGASSAILATEGSANDLQTGLALNDDTAVSVSAAKSLTISGTIANASVPKTLTFNGAGTTILPNANTYGPASGTVGTILTGGGVLKLGNNGALGAGDLSVIGNSTLQMGAPLSLGNNIALGTGATATMDNNGNSLALNGVISGNGNLAKIGNGALTLGSANTYGGSTAVDGGVLSISSAGSLGTAPGSATPNDVVLNGGDLLATSSLDLSATRGIGIGSSTGSVGATGLLDATSGQTLTVDGIIASAGNTGANGLVVNAGSGNNGTIVLTGANTFSGTTVISNGTLQLGNSLALQDSTLDYDNHGGALTFGSLTAATFGGLSGGQDLSLLNNSSAAVALTVGGNGSATTYSGILSGAGVNLTKIGNGTLTLSGNNSITGTTAVSAGMLQLNSGGVLNLTSGAANVSTTTGAQLVVAGGTLTAANASSIGKPSAGLLVSSGSATFNGGLNVQANQNATGLISVTGGSLTASSLTLTRFNNNFTAQPTAGFTTDGLYVNGGAVNITGNMTMVQSENSTVNARIDSGSLSIGGVLTIALNNTGRWSVMDVNGGAFSVPDTATGVQVGGSSAGNALLLVRNGTATVGKVSLGFGTVADTVVLNQTGGSLYIGAGGIAQTGSSATASVTLNGGTLGAATDWASSMPMALGGTTIQAADSGNVPHNITLSGALSGGALVKSGGGVLSLNGANTYSGITTVGNGTLLVNGSIGAGAVSVATVLGGSGTIGGVATVQPTGTLSPGTGGIGTLTLSASPVLQGTLWMEIDRNGGAPQNDQLAVPGNPLAFGGLLAVSNVGLSLQAGDTFQIFNAASYTGGFANIILPALDSSLAWNTNNLAVNGSISVVSASLTPPTLLSSKLVGGGFQLTFSGPASQSYRVLMGTNLTQPLSNWQPLVTNTFDSNPATFTDTNTSDRGRFYIIVSP
jgi:autotransporter-associated beta strand protein